MIAVALMNSFMAKSLSKIVSVSNSPAASLTVAFASAEMNPTKAIAGVLYAPHGILGTKQHRDETEQFIVKGRLAEGDITQTVAK